MLRTLLLVGLLALAILSGTTPASAQFLVAGQTTGGSYSDISPDISLSATPVFANGTAGSNVLKIQTLDLDGDGRADLQFVASGSITAGSLYQTYGTGVQMLHTDVQSYASIALRSTDTIQQRLTRPDATGQPGAWGAASTFTSYVYNPLNPANSVRGDWTDKQDHYLGLRLRSNAAAAWRYGWLRVQVTSSSLPASLLAKDYALTAQTLAVLPPQAASWQLYPTHVADKLIIEPPSPAAQGQATVYDLGGRPLLRAALSGRKQLLELAGLAAGVYVVRLETPAGSFAQRISKL